MGGEYSLGEFTDFLATHGTMNQSSCTDTPSQNGRAERKHCHLLDTARSLLLSSHMPIGLWGEAVLTAAYVLNRMPTPLMFGSSPYERLYGKVPNYSLLHVFGFTRFILLPKRNCTKLSARCALCVFVGYSIQQKGYKCHDPVSKKLYVYRHVPFLERLPSSSLPSKPATVSKEDLVHIDPFPLEVPVDDYVRTLEVFDVLVVPSAASDSHLIHPFPQHYVRHPTSASTDSDSPDRRYPTRDLRPPVRLGFSNTCFSCSYCSFLSRIQYLL